MRFTNTNVQSRQGSYPGSDAICGSLPCSGVFSCVLRFSQYPTANNSKIQFNLWCTNTCLKYSLEWAPRRFYFNDQSVRLPAEIVSPIGSWPKHSFLPKEAQTTKARKASTLASPLPSLPLHFHTHSKPHTKSMRISDKLKLAVLLNKIVVSSSLGFLLVNLRNRTEEERRRQSLCDKRDNNSVWKTFPPNFTLL